MKVSHFLQDKKPLLIAGPCVIETMDITMETARILKDTAENTGFSFLFKASFDKANRTSISSYRGPGMDKGLSILESVKKKLGVPVISDIHETYQAKIAAQVLDCIQIPAFLCRQTDLLVAAGETGKTVNIKKGQHMAPWDMKHVVNKFVETGNNQILLTERGSCFGYNNLVVDMRSLKIMQDLGFPVIFDATHSVQLPGAGDGCSSGQREYVPILAKAAAAAGADGIFMEVHPDPDKALCDGPNSLHIDDVEKLLRELSAIIRACQS